MNAKMNFTEACSGRKTVHCDPQNTPKTVLPNEQKCLFDLRLNTKGEIKTVQIRKNSSIPSLIFRI